MPKIAVSLSKPTINGGGWLVGLSNNLSKEKEVDLTVCFPISNERDIIKGKIENIKYYGFPYNITNSTSYDSKLELYFETIINQVKPDIINIFGTEYPHTLAMVNVCEKLRKINNVVISIQGLASIASKHYFANLPSEIINRYTLRDFIKQDNIRQQRNKFIKRGKYEKEALRKVHNIIGRTTWDKACTSQINPKGKYYFCNETLRDTFYQHKWDLNKCEKYSIFVSQSSYPIKGFHHLLEAMPEVLKKYPGACIYTTGTNPLNLQGFKSKIKMHSYQKYIGQLIKRLNLEERVIFLGNLNEQEMCDRFLRSHVFVSPSSIENSPNSVGEAMILGVPTISSDVGGVKDILKHNVDGIIYQSDAQYMLAYHICEIFTDNNLALMFSRNARDHGKGMYNREANTARMLEIYRMISGDKS